MWAVSTSDNGTLKVWDLGSGRQLHTLRGHSGWVLGVTVSPDGRWVASVSDDKTLKVWDLDSGTIMATFTCDAPANCCAFAGNTKIVAGDDLGRLHFLQLEILTA